MSYFFLYAPLSISLEHKDHNGVTFMANRFVFEEIWPIMLEFPPGAGILFLDNVFTTGLGNWHPEIF